MKLKENYNNKKYIPPLYTVLFLAMIPIFLAPILDTDCSEPLNNIYQQAILNNSVSI